jgi:molecular chaperone GrpE
MSNDTSNPNEDETLELETPAEPPEIDAAAAEAEIAKLRDETLRALAEVENVRKRGERAAQEARVFAIDRFARDLLDVADNLTRALATMPETTEEPGRTMREGVAMTEAQLLAVFERHGVKRVGAAGDRFDPNVHQAVTTLPSERPAGTVAEVLQHGYTLSERILRAAMVAVSAGPPAPATDQAEEEPPGGRVDIKV